MTHSRDQLLQTVVVGAIAFTAALAGAGVASALRASAPGPTPHSAEVNEAWVDASVVKSEAAVRGAVLLGLGGTLAAIALGACIHVGLEVALKEAGAEKVLEICFKWAGSLSHGWLAVSLGLFLLGLMIGCAMWHFAGRQAERRNAEREAARHHARPDPDLFKNRL